MEIISGAAASVAAEKFAEYTVAPIAGPFINFWKYKSNLENLKKQVKKLEAKRDGVQLQIKVGEESLPDVKLWLDDVNKIITEVSKLINEDDPDQQHVKCCKGFTYSNLKDCYQRRKNVPLKLKDVVELEAREFKEVSHRTTPEMNQPRKESEVSESRMSISEDIIAALSYSDVNMVGIYGMGGVGKTTLAREVETQAMQDKIFNKIVFVEVSQSPDIRTIQGVIADYLGLQFQEESVPGRARKLCEVLKKEEKILLIIDNIWGSINFEEVGIPFKNDNKELKFLLTTRSLDVLTKEMDSQRNFHVEALCEADAWSLFKSKAGTCVDHPHLKFVAREVAKKCGGMPIAIVTIAKALKNTRAEAEWNDALRRLNNLSSESVDGITKEVYNSVKLSYDYLDEELKEIFLLCSRMRCSYNASIRDLFRYGLGLGLFKTFNTLEEALCNVYASVNKLKANSLLLDAPKSEYAFFDAHSSEKFAMHDVVCAIARSIAFKDQNVFNVTDVAIPSHLANGYSLRICTSITLHNIGELPNDLKLVCPQLKFLYMQAKPSSFMNMSLKIPNEFFIGMLGLQVLHVLDMDLSSPPTSLSGLVNLQTICLERCRLKHIGVIGDLKNLEILSFRGSLFQKLPEEMCRLTKLKLLDLTNCYRLSDILIPPNVMSSFKKLEALYMLGSAKLNNERRNFNLDELEQLSNLTTLEIKLPDVAVSRGFLSQKLERYRIIIGKHYRTNQETMMPFIWNIPVKTSRFLKVLNTNEDGVISRLRGIRQLELEEVPGVVNILDLDTKGFPELECITIKNNSHILHIVDTKSGDDVFSILESLILWNLNDLKKICNGPLGVKSFYQIRTIRVGKCNKLIDIFSFATNRVFQKLEEIEVIDCENIEEILAIGEQVHEIKLNKLRILKLKNLPRLKSLCCKVKTTSHGEIISKEEVEEEHDIPKPLFNSKVAFPKLETLNIENINVEIIWDNQLSTMSFVQTLTSLIISNLSKLRRLWSENSIIEFPSLKEMKIQHCPKLEFIFDNKVEVTSLENIQIIAKEGVVAGEMPAIAWFIFPKLTSLELYNLPELKSLYPSRQTVEWPVLNMLTMCQCGIHDKNVAGLLRNEVKHPKTSDGLTIHVERILPSLLQKMGSWVQNLTELIIHDCGNLKELFSSSMVELRDKEMGNTISFPKLCYLEMNHVANLTRLCSGCYIEFPSLKEFKISNCLELKACIFDDKVTFPKLEILNIENINVEMIWDNQLSTVSFVQTLTCLIISNLSKLRRLWPKNFIVEFPSLKKMAISSCPKLEFIFDNKVGVTSLERMLVSRMDNLKNICNGPLEVESFHQLRTIRVEKCNKLIDIFSLETNMVFEELENFEVCDCENMEEILAIREQVHEIKFNRLRILILKILPRLKLKPLFNDKIAFPKLETLKIKKVNVEVIWDNQLSIMSFVQTLTCLIISNLSKLRRLWFKNSIIEFPSLKQMEIQHCPKLDFIFDDKVRVTNLESIQVIEMDNLKMICHNQLIQDSFSKLKSVKVKKCRKLLTMFPFTTCGMISSLESLNVEECESLEEIFDLQGVNFEERHSMTATQARECQSLSFASLQYLNVSECQSLKNLFSTLIIAKECVVAEETPAIAQFIFPKLTSLELYKLPELKSFYPGRHTMELPILKKMYQCCIHVTKEKGRFILLQNQVKRPKTSDGLTVHVERIWASLFQTMGSWVQNLTTLIVHDCGNIKELFPSSMVEIRDKEMGNTISFPKLGYLEMNHLATLTRLCSGYYIEFPSLKEFKISNCPELKTCIFDDKVGVTSLKNIQVTEMDNLKMICHNQPVQDSFSKLKSLEVKKCRNLLTVLPLNMCGIISSLESLNVKECKSLEEIFDLQGVNFEERHSIIETQVGECQSLSFANLQYLNVSECQSLKNLFSPLIIAKEGVVAEETPTITRFIFPKLTSLELYKLPELKSFYPGRHTMEWPIINMLMMYQCGIHDTEEKGVTQMLLLRNQIKCSNGLTVHVERIWPSLLQTMGSSFQNLTKLSVHDCDDLKELFPSSLIELRETKMRNTISLPKLVYLEMDHHENLTRLCSGYYIKFPSLIKLKISNCPELKACIFDDKVAFPKLKILDIENINVEMIWDNQLSTKTFVQTLTCLIISNLSKLRQLWFENSIVEFPSLKIMKIQCCPKLEFVFDNKVGLCSLEKIQVIQMDNLNMIWHNQLVEDSFSKLKSFKVEKCPKLLTVFPSNMFRRISSLESLIVEECKSLVEIFDLHGINSGQRPSITTTQTGESCTINPQITLFLANLQNLEVTECRSLENLFSSSIVAKEGVAAKEAHATAKFVFPKLTSFKLHELRKLRTFYPGIHTMEWPVLDILKMYQFSIHGTNENLPTQVEHSNLQTSNGLKVHVKMIWMNLLHTMGSWVPNLTKLSVYDCGNLKELFPSSLVELREKEMNSTISFPKLVCLEMDNLENLTRLCSGYYIEFPSLIEFKISNCPELKTYIFDDKVGVSSLEKMQVVKMDNLKMIWHNQLAEDSFSKLKSFEVKNCHKLLTLFPSNMCGRISSLESLIVEECKSLIEIFDVQGMNSKERSSIGASQTGEFCSDNPQITLSFANLQNLKVRECKSLKNLFSASIVAKDGVRATEAPATAMFVFPKLASLVLHKLPDLRTLYPGKYTVEGPALKILNMHACGIQDTDNMYQMQQPLFLLVEKAFPCLEKLILAGKDLNIMWQEQDTESFFRKFKILKILDEFDQDDFSHDNQTSFCYFGDVKHMWKQNFKLDLVLPNFEDIRLRGCDSFISLMPSYASFQNVTSLTVDGCHTLEHILTFAVAKSLVKLVEMRISCCKKITKVVGNQGDVTEDKIIFSNLESLSLTTLPNLSSFCSCNCTLEFPFLESLDVLGCSNMKIFSRGNLIMKRLQNVEINKKSIQLCPDVDFNTTLQKFFEKKKWQISAEDESDSSSD